jgi:hypothetical protein
MIRAQYAIVAEFQREGPGGKFDLLGTFDRIFAPGVPAQHRHLVFVVLLVADTEDDLGKKPFRFRVVTPANAVLVEQHGQVDLKPGAGTWLGANRLAFELEGMPVPDYGKYRFTLEVGGREVASHPLSVAPPPAPDKK